MKTNQDLPWSVVIPMVVLTFLWGVALYSAVWFVGKVAHWFSIIPTYPPWLNNQLYYFLLGFILYHMWLEWKVKRYVDKTRP